MITKAAFSTTKSFSIPSTFTEETSYVLQCTADYYNLGSRRDSFYDTFTIITVSTSDGGSPEKSGTPNKTTPSITGKTVDDSKPKLSPPEIEEFNPFSPKRNWAFIFIEVIIFIGIITLINFLIKKKHKNQEKN